MHAHTRQCGKQKYVVNIYKEIFFCSYLVECCFLFSIFFTRRSCVGYLLLVAPLWSCIILFFFFQLLGTSKCIMGFIFLRSGFTYDLIYYSNKRHADLWAHSFKKISCRIFVFFAHHFGFTHLILFGRQKKTFEFWQKKCLTWKRLKSTHFLESKCVLVWVRVYTKTLSVGPVSSLRDDF